MTENTEECFRQHQYFCTSINSSIFFCSKNNPSSIFIEYFYIQLLLCTQIGWIDIFSPVCLPFSLNLYKTSKKNLIFANKSYFGNLQNSLFRLTYFRSTTCPISTHPIFCSRLKNEKTRK